MLRSLAEIPFDHPSRFGETAVIDPEPLVMEEDATVLPRVNIRQGAVWARSWSQGVFDAKGNHIVALNDMRSNRHMFYPATRLEEAAGYNPEITADVNFMLYGGTIYEHFGDLLVDLSRAYQLMRAFRHSKKPIWFHYAVRGSIRSIRVPYVKEWLRCLGLHKRFRLIHRPVRAKQLVSCPQIYCDLRYISRDYPAAARAALQPRLRRQLDQITRDGARIAYLSRHKLATGTTQFVQEGELVEQLRHIPRVDIICPEELNFKEKLSLWRRYTYIAGFPQGCMMLKPFVPHHETDQIARHVFLLAGPNSFPSTWLNVEQVCDYGDLYLDCHGAEEGGNTQPRYGQGPGQTFSRSNSIDVPCIVDAMKELAASLR